MSIFFFILTDLSKNENGERDDFGFLKMFPFFQSFMLR
ncbi:hypothetical protein FM130_00805 [Enterococcus faecium]|nr:hypothetical protein FM130_00805 [Enterococcus faecium]